MIIYCKCLLVDGCAWIVWTGLLRCNMDFSNSVHVSKMFRFSAESLCLSHAGREECAGVGSGQPGGGALGGFAVEGNNSGSLGTEHRPLLHLHSEGSGGGWMVVKVFGKRDLVGTPAAPSPVRVLPQDDASTVVPAPPWNRLGDVVTSPDLIGSAGLWGVRTVPEDVCRCLSLCGSHGQPRGSAVFLSSQAHHAPEGRPGWRAARGRVTPFCCHLSCTRSTARPGRSSWPGPPHRGSFCLGRSDA